MDLLFLVFFFLNKVAANILKYFFWWTQDLFLLELLSHWLYICLAVEDIVIFLKCINSHLYQQSVRVPTVPHPCQQLVLLFS